MLTIRSIMGRVCLLLGTALAAALLLAACDTEQGTGEDPINLVYAVRVGNAEIIDSDVAPLPDDAFSIGPVGRKSPVDSISVDSLKRIHPLLNKWIRERDGDEQVQVVVNFSDTLTIPRFPGLVTGKPRDSDRNRKALARAQALIQDIKAQRAGNYARLTKELEGRYDATVPQTFWLINGMVVEIALRHVEDLADLEEVLYVEPVHTDDGPPNDTSPSAISSLSNGPLPPARRPDNHQDGDDLADGRTRIASDPYFNLGLSGSRLGLLDTGIRASHILFQNPSHIGDIFDCITDSSQCINCTTNPSQCTPSGIGDCGNHGTSSAGIITGNDRLGNAFRGVTSVKVDVFKVYDTCVSGYANTQAVINAFEYIKGNLLDQVIVAEVENIAPYYGNIARVADEAFDAGIVVIAANGNSGSVKTPANAHKVIGVGDFRVQTGYPVSGHSQGPTGDNRIKPDILAPSQTETASNEDENNSGLTPPIDPDSSLQIYSGTSGAAPYAGGAAVLWRNWLLSATGRSSIDPGQVYALLLLSGQRPSFNNQRGAGNLRMLTDGWIWWGKASVSHGEEIDIPLPVKNESYDYVDGALWWPETFTQSSGYIIEAHSNINLYLLDPNGAPRDTSLYPSSVFERVREDASITPGTWKLRIRGEDVPEEPQTVYWAAAAWRKSTTTPITPTVRTGPQATVFLNEIHYDNAGSDTGEGIEVAGPAGTDLTGWRIVLYNGNSGGPYHTMNLSGVIQNHCNGFGVITFPKSGIQNGPADGIALIDPSNTVVQFLSYEGAFESTSSPAFGITSTDIGVSEDSSTPVGNSLQLTGAGTTYGDFAWDNGAPHTFGACNTGQTRGNPLDVVINEVDTDTPGTDDAEFVELYDGGTGYTPLNGLVLVFFDGDEDKSYRAYDLDGYSTDANGFFVLCSNVTNVPNCDLDVTPNTNLIQNGADAVALYTGDANNFPNNTPATATNLIDALVYDTNDPDDEGLLYVLTPGPVQVNEAGGTGSSANNANARRPDGGPAFDTSTYVQQAPTPGTTNVIPSSTP